MDEYFSLNENVNIGPQYKFQRWACYDTPRIASTNLKDSINSISYFTEYKIVYLYKHPNGNISRAEVFQKLRFDVPLHSEEILRLIRYELELTKYEDSMSEICYEDIVHSAVLSCQIYWYDKELIFYIRLNEQIDNLIWKPFNINKKRVNLSPSLVSHIEQYIIESLFR